MGNWFEFEFNPPYAGDEVTSINGVTLPDRINELWRNM